MGQPRPRVIRAIVRIGKHNREHGVDGVLPCEAGLVEATGAWFIGGPIVKPRASCRITRRSVAGRANSLTQKLCDWGSSSKSGVRRPQIAPSPTTRAIEDNIQYFTIVADLGASWVIVPRPNRVRAPIPLGGAITHFVDLSDR